MAESGDGETGSDTGFRLNTLKKRAEFQRVRGGGRWAAAAFVMEGRERPDGPTALAGPRFGFTITKAIGSAVVRNRIRRRFREALRVVAPRQAAPRFDYVLVARDGAIEMPFAALLEALQAAFARVNQGPMPSRQRGRDAAPRRAGSDKGSKRVDERPKRD